MALNSWLSRYIVGKSITERSGYLQMKDAFYCHVANEEYLTPIKRWLYENANLRYNEWQGLFIEGPQENGYLITFPGVSKKVFLKCFGVRKKKINMDFFGLFSKALHAYNISCSLFKRGITTPEPLAYVKIKKGPNKGIELLITEWIEDAVTLRFFLNILFSQIQISYIQKHKRKIVTELALFVKRLHSAGVYHRDFNAENILVREKENGLNLYIIDTGDMKIANYLSQSRIIRNLDKVNRYVLNTRQITLADRIRFLKIYLGDKGCKDRKLIRYYWNEVWKITSETLNKHNKIFFKS